ncbi:MAG: protein kinase [Kofleriaceae bacterium]
MPREPQTETVHGRRPRVERDPLVGTVLDGRYQIEARIATGGFGAIYRARTTAGDPVALKVLHPSLSGDPTMVARFRREGATLTQLHDPHTVTTLAVGETDDGTLYIAMELLTGESLHDRLYRVGALPWRAAVAIARAVCSSLAEAHALGVVHRDLKPANIQVEARDGADFVKVIDFGIVKIARGSSIDDGAELTYAGHMIGTFDYMSPEQLLGSECRDVSDVYAVGVVLYEMLVGRRPFAAVTNPAAMIAAMLTETPASPAQLAVLPLELGQLVMRCLEREPHDRFASIVALAAALDRVVVTHDATHEAVTTVHAAWAPITTVDEERTWIDPSVRPVPALDDDRKETVRDPWHLPLCPSRTGARTAPLEAQVRRVPNGTPAPQISLTPPRALGLAVAPGARTTPTYVTLPGIAVVAPPGASLTPPRAVPAVVRSIDPTRCACEPSSRGSRPSLRGSHPILRGSAPVLAAPVQPTPYPLVPNEWRTPAAPLAAYHPTACTTQSTRPASMAWKAVWLALVVAFITTVVLAVGLGAIP